MEFNLSAPEGQPPNDRRCVFAAQPSTVAPPATQSCRWH